MEYVTIARKKAHEIETVTKLLPQFVKANVRLGVPYVERSVLVDTGCKIV